MFAAHALSREAILHVLYHITRGDLWRSFGIKREYFVQVDEERA